ncbi:MAG: HAMP domain-containing sensor histidine kinase [Candidatus Gracilibacteria bacterium]|nr:HAMP domain-containing sensor histidine kinase [Candidatus Gracilibacteria bacterium]
MNNFKLLENYRKKLSVYFALFVLFSFWITQAIFLIVEYIPYNLKLEKILEKRLVGVINVIQNHDKYLEKLNNQDSTLGKILVKTLENVVICSDCINGVCKGKIVDHINETDDFIFTKNSTFFDRDNYKYLKKDIVYNGIGYQVIIKNLNEHSMGFMLRYYMFFVLFSIPFATLFYFIGYYFVGKNFEPIRETITGLEDFTSNINHEMKTPLAEIISTLSLAKRTKNYDEAIAQSLVSTKKLNTILDSMIGIINIIDSSYKKQRFDAIRTINSIVKDYTKDIEKKQIVIEKKYSNKNHYLNTNKEHFEICVGNILKNAIKYSDNKGVINISYNDGSLEIKDFGVGITKANLKHIFDRYFRENYTKEEGYGIGLALVKKIVDIHSWKISITSKKKNTITGEKGTTVKLIFS